MARVVHFFTGRRQSGVAFFTCGVAGFRKIDPGDREQTHETPNDGCWSDDDRVAGFCCFASLRGGTPPRASACEHRTRSSSRFCQFVQRFRSDSEAEQLRRLPAFNVPSGPASGTAVVSSCAGDQLFIRGLALPVFLLPLRPARLQFVRVFDQPPPPSVGRNIGSPAGVQFQCWSRWLRHGDLAGDLPAVGVVGRGAEPKHGRREGCVRKRTSPVVAGVRDELAAPHLLPGGHGYSPLSSSDSFISNCPILR